MKWGKRNKTFHGFCNFLGENSAISEVFSPLDNPVADRTNVGNGLNDFKFDERFRLIRLRKLHD